MSGDSAFDVVLIKLYGEAVGEFFSSYSALEKLVCLYR